MAVSEITVDDTNHDQQITLEKGNTLIIQLLSNPGIGYGWQIIKNDADKLQPVGDSVLEPLEEEAPGATENQVFRFLAQDTGFTSVELHYLRPWESNIPPLKTYRLNVQIH
ncbi:MULTISPECIES: protease inhibitor I42 family protein [unclassified Anabaena]|uniref:protease inhibitor I42 family protein n=1 Tax=unclassified Anabaena TaxID=2619674 RepID=UPI0039C74AB5